MKPRLLLQALLLKLTSLVSLILFFSFSVSTLLSTPPEASQQGSSTGSKSGTAASKPASKQAVVKSSSKAGTKKKTASRSKKSRRKVVRGQRTIESSRVVEIQSALAAAGYYKDEPSGEWDDSTSKAMSSYQQDNGFRTTGKPDALSLKKLGL